MRPKNLKAKIFADTGDPQEVEEILDFLRFLDGVTTNPTLIARHPEVQKRLKEGNKFSREEVKHFYKEIVVEVSKLIPKGSVSIEVYADKNTIKEEMLKEAREFFDWIPNAHIKLPITRYGLEAAEEAIKEGIRVNMTLCFSQQQAAAVYAATRGAKIGQVFISPFVGRLDDQGRNGMDLIENIIVMYRKGDGHVEVLTASVRNFEHFIYALKLKSDIITSPIKILKEWKNKNLMPSPPNYLYEAKNKLDVILYQELDLDRDWQEFNIQHELTDKGLESFASDWNSLIK